MGERKGISRAAPGVGSLAAKGLAAGVCDAGIVLLV